MCWQKLRQRPQRGYRRSRFWPAGNHALLKRKGPGPIDGSASLEALLTLMSRLFLLVCRGLWAEPKLEIPAFALESTMRKLGAL